MQARKGKFGAHPWIGQAKRYNAHVICLLNIHQGRRRAVTKSPKDNLRAARNGLAGCDDRSFDVRHQILESLQGAATVADAAMVESQDVDTSTCQMPCQMDELPMATNTVLWPAHDDDDNGVAW